MKLLKELRQELVRIGATQRLQELNQERDALVKLLNSDSNKAKKIIKHVKRKKYILKKKHWTQLPKNRAKMLKNVRNAMRNQ